jgi:hypothetical protein
MSEGRSTRYCLFCSVSIKGSFRDLEEHVQTMHVQKPPPVFECPWCLKHFTTAPKRNEHAPDCSHPRRPRITAQNRGY